MLTIQEVAAAVDGSLIGGPVDDRPLSSVVVDSRQVESGSLFVALKGQKHDGHDFLLDAFAKGARAALVAQVPDEIAAAVASRSMPVIQVPDTLAALQQMAHFWRRHLGLKVVGITGSVGKTTTKEVVAGLLSGNFQVLKTEGNLNTEIGLPLTMLKATPKDQVLVLEMGMYAVGEIRALARIAMPDVGIVTNVGPTHLERLGSIDRIAEAKGELVEELPAEGLAVLNLEDERVRAMSSRTRARVTFYGMDSRADLWADAVQSRGLRGIEFDLRCRGDGAREDSWVHVRMPLLGLHSVQAALAAAAVGQHMGMMLDEIAAGLHEVSASLRLIVAVGINGSTIVDDSYNASPASTMAALNLLAEMEGRKVAVLGDMRELGSFAEEGHRMVGRRAADVVDVLISVGSMGALIGQEALTCGRRQDEVWLVQGNEAAIERLKTILRPGDCVLVKGSRGMHMEEIVEAIRCPTH